MNPTVNPDGPRVEAHPMGQSLALQIGGKQVPCPICGETAFAARKIMLNTRKLTFFNLDFLNKTATTYRCLRCSHLLWFED